MLIFVGMGIYDERDISVKGLEAVKKADAVYAELYTHKGSFSIERLSKFFGREIKELKREDLEERAERIIEEAREKDVVLLSGGDAMVSTTHADLMIRAKRMGVQTKIIHASSIISAIPGITGLQNYRFGKSATVVYPYFIGERRILPETPYDVILQNLRNDAHTLLFLDIRERCMTIPEAVEILLEIDDRRERILRGRIAIGVARAGSDDCTVAVDRIERLIQKDFGDPPHSLVIPASLHVIEEEYIKEVIGGFKE
ncbi:MAG: diphthine synthase [Archaeoglobi archaeon]|nr:diphthine synthase [Candidatus Mnemosynella sp.]